jgi:hypothetical protein
MAVVISCAFRLVALLGWNKAIQKAVLIKAESPLAEQPLG